MSTVAIIPARGGSRGIPGKNLLPLCGKPLIVWSIEHARAARLINRVFVSSDSAEILEVAERAGARAIQRPPELADDSASSESAWLHAIDAISHTGVHVDLVAGIQATSPVREPEDIDGAIARFRSQNLDSLLACSALSHPLLWRLQQDGTAAAAHHDPNHRLRRQESQPQYLENGSFYLFSAELLRRTGCRLGGRIGLHIMPQYKMFQIDEPADVRLCEVILEGYGLVKSK